MTAVKKTLLCCLLLALVWSLTAVLREDADRLSFGNVYVGGHYNRTYTWTNSNSFPVTFFQITLTGSRAFSNSELPELPLICAPGEGYSYQINFDPIFAGAHYCQTNHTTDFPGQQQWSNYHSGTAFWPTIHRLPYYQDCSTEFAVTYRQAGAGLLLIPTTPRSGSLKWTTIISSWCSTTAIPPVRNTISCLLRHS